VPVPAEVAEGDVVLVHVVENKGYLDDIEAPSQVEALGDEVDDGSSLGSRLYVYEVPADPVESLTFSGDFSQMSATATAYRGASEVTVMAHDADSGRDEDHPVSGTVTPGGWNVVLGSDRIYERGARTSTWRVDDSLTERLDAGGSNGGKSALSQVVADTGAAASSDEVGYDLSASQDTKYAVTALVSLTG
jgi:hypothetical protein